MNRTITTTSITRRRRSLRHAALALCAVLVALVAASCTADALDGTDTGTPSGNTNPDDVLTFAVGPRPGFTEVPVSGDGTASADAPATRSIPATRAEQTDNATRWEQGDILWLDVRLHYDKVNNVVADTSYISALKYDVDKWRYLTEAEVEALDAGNIPRFSRLVSWPRGSKDWVDPGMEIYAAYGGSGKPNADGTITINPTGEIPATPFIAGRSGICSPDGRPVPLEFIYGCSRIRIPAGCKVELTNAEYRSTIGFPLGTNTKREQITEIPEQSEATDVFLGLGVDATAKLIRDNVSCTFTFPEVTNAEGNLTHDGVSYTLTPYTSGTETPGGYDLTVATEDDLRALAQAVNADEKLPNGKPAAEARVLQTANIKLTQGEWVPIGNAGSKSFRGAYNGNGHEITGLTISTASQLDARNRSYAGLFGCAEEALLTGIHLREVKINIPQDSSEGYLYAGSIAGRIDYSTLSFCTAAGTVKASSGTESVSAGGIAGSSWYSTISRCRADVETKAVITDVDGGNAFAGGIAGWNAACSFILSCETQDGAVVAEGIGITNAGGITGGNLATCLIAFCRTGTNAVKAQNASRENYAGGLVGNNWGGLYSCYSRATAEAPTGTGNKRAGAIAGLNNKQDRVQHCYATGSTGPGTSGGLNAVPGSIVYNANPNEGDIFRVMTGYTGKVESLTEPGTGTLYYPFTTSYAPSATPAYGIIPQRAVWKSDGAWNIGDGKYPGLNIEEYEGK